MGEITIRQAQVRFAIIQQINRPYTVEAGLLEKLVAIERVIPFGQIKDIEIQRAIGSGIESGRDPLLILELAVVDLISGSPIGE